ncbi:MAG: diacylglycerol kinase family protein [Clostridia bacterium]|nr:diacylglycerol kinase family protein [Clostridia bacterium]
MIYVLYNPYSNSGDNDKQINDVMERFSSVSVQLMSVAEVDDPVEFFKGQHPGDETILLGGDGTLNRMINALDGYVPENKLWLYKAGTGNDFINDVYGGNAPDGTLLQINDYIRDLPEVMIRGKKYRFINNCAFGIDGKVCRVGDELKAKFKRRINYTLLAARVLLTYKRSNAKITVDGVTYEFKDVWLAPTMNGRYFGGGMKVAPMQDRNSDNLTLVVFHSASLLRTFTIFPRIFGGSHVKFKQYFSSFQGKEISVEYDLPQDVQIDGEVIPDVLSYSVVKQPVLVNS